MVNITTGKRYLQRNGQIVTVLSTVGAGGFPVVIQHDTELNGIVLAFFSVAGWKKKMSHYRESMGLPEPPK